MEDISIKYDEVSDILEYGNITDERAILICNDMIDKSILEKNDAVLESMYNAILTAVNNRDIAISIDTNKIVENIDMFNEEIADYIITILAYSGKEQYVKIIKKLGQKYSNLDIDEALSELTHRI